MKKKKTYERTPLQGMHRSRKAAERTVERVNKEKPSFYTRIEAHSDGSFSVIASDPGEGLPW